MWKADIQTKGHKQGTAHNTATQDKVTKNSNLTLWTFNSGELDFTFMLTENCFSFHIQNQSLKSRCSGNKL